MDRELVGKALGYAILIFAGAAATYLLFGFVSLIWNPLVWTPEARLLWVFGSLTLGALKLVPEARQRVADRNRIDAR